MKKLLLTMAVVIAGTAVRAYDLKPSSPEYTQAARSHTGIPSVAVSRANGRLWATYYCAWRWAECANNYVVLATSADGGKTWKEVLVADPDGDGPLRNFDPELFIAADGRLVWSWTERKCPDNAPWNGCGADPSNDRLMFVRLDAENEPSAPYPPIEYATYGVMMCKPIALKDGRTLLPVAHWFKEPSACFYATKDWKRFDYVGGASIASRSDRQFDEHAVIERGNGELVTWIRTSHEPRESVSKDGGKTWSEPEVSQVGNPNSRLFVTKLKNGHLLMVKHGRMGEHFKEKGWLPRRELRAFVSDDEGRSWKGDLLLDDRKGLSYPDGDIAADGSVYVVYDRDRCNSGEVAIANITEADVLAGELVSKDSFLGRTVTVRSEVHGPEYAMGMKTLPLGAVKPEGWLRYQLELWRDGLTGHGEEIYNDIGESYWLVPKTNNDARVKNGDGQYGWERGPYYAKGLVSLAFTLGDEKLIAQAKRWVDALLASQRENGDIGPKNDNWWANMPALCFVRDWCEAAGDSRVEDFLFRYFAYQLKRLPEHPLNGDSFWARARGGDNLEVVLWLHQRTGDNRLLLLAKLLAEQSADWTDFYHDGGEGGYQNAFRMHIVNFMQGLKFPALAASFMSGGKWAKGMKAYSAAFDENGWEMRMHGRVDRMLNGTELLPGRAAADGTELCAQAERILSCQNILRTNGWFGDGFRPADDMEVIAYNTLPSTLADNGKGVRYYHVLNMPRCANNLRHGFENNQEGGAMVPGPDAGFGCCRSNFHFAWPKFVQSMWFRGGFHMGGGLVATAYGPCTVSNELATIVEGGDYPFGDTVTMKFARVNGKEWPLILRVPRWCDEKMATMKLNGEEIRPVHGGIRRKWEIGDELVLTFPGKTVVEKGANDSIAIRRGAIVYALAPEAEITEIPGKPGYPAREYHPKTPWNYAISMKDDFEFVPPSDLSGNVFAHGRVTSALKVKAYRTGYAGWGTYRADGHYNGRAIEPPPSPVAGDRLSGEPETLTLVPMGATQIRITIFPWTK